MQKIVSANINNLTGKDMTVEVFFKNEEVMFQCLQTLRFLQNPEPKEESLQKENLIGSYVKNSQTDVIHVYEDASEFIRAFKKTIANSIITNLNKLQINLILDDSDILVSVTRQKVDEQDKKDTVI